MIARLTLRKTADMSLPESDREVKALQQLDRFFPLQRMVIVTFDEEGIIEIAEGKQIEVIPAWKWLLETVPL